MCTRLYVYSIDLDPRLYVYPSLSVPVSMCTHVFLLVSDWPFFYLIERVIPLDIKLFVSKCQFHKLWHNFRVYPLGFTPCRSQSRKVQKRVRVRVRVRVESCPTN
jgi:hypothetical protein